MGMDSLDTGENERFCLHRRRKVAVVVFLLFSYLFFRQVVHLIRASRGFPLVYGNLRIPTLTILAGILFAVAIMREVKCQPERAVLGLVVIESLGALAAILVASPFFVTAYRALSVSTRLACAVITGVLIFRSPQR